MLSRAVALVLSVVIAGIAVVVQPSTLAGAGTTTTGAIGMASHMFWLSEADARAEMQQLAAAGITQVREDFRWDVLEPANGTFDWRRSDAIMAAAASTGVEVLAILTYSAKWASSDPSGGGSIYYPPRDPADYGDYAAAVVRRYGDGGTFWAERPDLPAKPLTAVELWNEPWGWWNWRSGVDPVGYARMARAGAEAVKAAAPSVRVLIAGDLLQVRTDGAIVGWLDELLKADPGLVQLADALSVHPYPYPRDQGPLVDHQDARWDYQRVRLIRDVAVSHGFDGPLWLTELGWSTAAQVSDAVTESEQATFLHDAVVRARTEWPYVERIYAYTWTRDNGNAGDREGNYGMRRSDGTFKPAWDVLVALAASTPVTEPVASDPVAAEPAPAPAPSSLWFSTSADRSGAVALEGAAVSGTVYAFAVAEGTVTSVAFRLDDPEQTGPARHTETQAPYDFAGGSVDVANPFATTDVADGAHTVTAVVTRGDGSQEVVHASFTVANAVTAEEPTQPVASEPAPIALTAALEKVRGFRTVSLSWAGATTSVVDLHRNGVLVATLDNDGSHADRLGKGGGTSWYQLCDAGSSRCSQVVAVG